MAKPTTPITQAQGAREKGQGTEGERLLEKPSTLAPAEVPLPTYLMYTEAVTLLVEKGGLRVSEARLVVGKIRQAPTKGEFRKWHYKDVLAKAEALRNDPEARA